MLNTRYRKRNNRNNRTFKRFRKQKGGKKVPILRNGLQEEIEVGDDEDDIQPDQDFDAFGNLQDEDKNLDKALEKRQERDERLKAEEEERAKRQGDLSAEQLQSILDVQLKKSEDDLSNAYNNKPGTAPPTSEVSVPTPVQTPNNLTKEAEETRLDGNQNQPNTVNPDQLQSELDNRLKITEDNLKKAYQDGPMMTSNVNNNYFPEPSENDNRMGSTNIPPKNPTFLNKVGNFFKSKSTSNKPRTYNVSFRVDQSQRIIMLDEFDKNGEPVDFKNYEISSNGLIKKNSKRINGGRRKTKKNK